MKSRCDDFYTPVEVLDYFGGGFIYDPSTTEEIANRMGIKYYDTIETDGLKRDWTQFKKIWVNPPFTKKFAFLKKAVETYKEDQTIEIYFLTTAESLCTKRFAEILKGISYVVYLPSGRISFENGITKETNRPSFSTVIVSFKCIRTIETVDIEKLKGK